MNECGDCDMVSAGNPSAVCSNYPRCQEVTGVDPNWRDRAPKPCNCGRCKKPTDSPTAEGLCGTCEWELEHARLGTVAMETSEAVGDLCSIAVMGCLEANLIAEGLDMAVMNLVEHLTDEKWRVGYKVGTQKALMLGFVGKVHRWADALRKVLKAETEARDNAAMWTGMVQKANTEIDKLTSTADDAAEYEQDDK